MPSTKVRDEIATLKKALADKTAVLDTTTSGFEVKAGKVRLDDAQAKAYQDAAGEATQIRALIQRADRHPPARPDPPGLAAAPHRRREVLPGRLAAPVRRRAPHRGLRRPGVPPR